jgi:alkanesulfonate monooxygenase SsuD/methylene tetrahydromethanopterin reductase-like flavin-dependent oxidoreductase (luciferase family)
MPRPVQRPHPAVVFGGHTKEAYSRTARLASGWFGFALDVDATVKCLDGLKAACATSGRNFADLEISVCPRGRTDRDTAKRFADAGVHRLILLHGARDERGILEMVATTGSTLIGKV